jgi:catechol 2,3-dioxygenase-like lactoylglutathione lyase family enzyme
MKTQASQGHGAILIKVCHRSPFLELIMGAKCPPSQEQRLTADNQPQYNCPTNSAHGGLSMLKGIDNVGIAISDLTRAITFYERLGFTKGDDYETDVKGCIMTAGSAMLFLFQTKQANPQAVKREPTLVQNPPGIDHISFLVEDVNETYAELKARGVEFLSEPADQDWGARLVGLKDPDGNNLYFLQYL